MNQVANAAGDLLNEAVKQLLVEYPTDPVERVYSGVKNAFKELTSSGKPLTLDALKELYPRVKMRPLLPHM